MMLLLYTGFAICAVITPGHGLSTKMDFGNDEAPSVVTNSSNTEDEDVEVKHTIVVSTKLKNSNRRGLHSSVDGEKRTLTSKIGRKTEKEDSGEVPVVNGYEAVETTEIRTPDTRFKLPTYPESVFISRNVRDEYDIYPNFVSANPSQWKPSTFYNNINWMNEGRTAYQTPGKFHRRITDDGMKEFYCRKCGELSGQGYKGCPQQRNLPRYLYETTTPKVKLDGKLAKLN